jgi:hypothetical protein
MPHKKLAYDQGVQKALQDVGLMEKTAWEPNLTGTGVKKNPQQFKQTRYVPKKPTPTLSRGEHQQFLRGFAPAPRQQPAPAPVVKQQAPRQQPAPAPVVKQQAPKQETWPSQAAQQQWLSQPSRLREPLISPGIGGKPSFGELEMLADHDTMLDKGFELIDPYKMTYKKTKPVKGGKG